MVPLYVARVADLRVGSSVSLTCRTCGHVAEIPATTLREKLSKDEFVKRLGPQFRCQQCGRKGADVDARRVDPRSSTSPALVAVSIHAPRAGAT